MNVHLFQGHFTKMTEEVTQYIRRFSEDGEWPTRMRTCKEKSLEEQEDVEIEIPLDVIGESRMSKKNLHHQE